MPSRLGTWPRWRGSAEPCRLLQESLTLGGVKSKSWVIHRFLNISLPLTTVLISIPTPPWKQGLNRHDPLPSHDTLPCNPPSPSKRICHSSSLLFPFFSGPGYRFQKASKAALSVKHQEHLHCSTVYIKRIIFIQKKTGHFQLNH